MESEKTVTVNQKYFGTANTSNSFVTVKFYTKFLERTIAIVPFARLPIEINSSKL